MYRAELSESDYLVKLIYDAVEIVYYIIACVPDVAGVKANAELVFFIDSCDYLRNFFKSPADLRPFTRHCFKEDGCCLLLGYDGVQQEGDFFNADLDSLSRVTAGMKIIHVSGRIFHAEQVILHRVKGELPCVLV